jgi:DNA polymerase elongation subunit (family B)
MERWVWIDSTWMRTDDFLPEIKIFARNYDEPTVTKTFTITDFRPYFYVPASCAFHPREVTQVDSKTILDAKGREVRKVFVRLPSDVVAARKAYDWTVEADIQFDFRHMLDTEVSYAFSFDEHNKIKPIDVPGTQLPRICFFDIEVRSPPTQFPKPAEAKWPIVSIQCMDSYTGDITIFTYGVPKLEPDQVACKTESEMLREFMNYLQRYDPDVLTGWNTNGFDIPYIVNRAKNIHVKLNRMTRIPDGYNKPVAELRQGTPADTPEEEKKRKKRKEEWFVRCTGRQLLDMLDAFKKFWKAEGELDSYTLKAIARNPDVMGDDVYVYEEQGSNMEKLFTEQRWDDFLSYCRSDVIALSKIDKKIKLFDFYENLRMMCGIKLEDTMKNSRIIETYLFRDPVMKPMPTRRYDIVGESYEGALVLTPKVGIFNNVAVYDLNALYPHIIIAFDLSPDIDHVIPRVIRYVMDERNRLKKLIKDGLADEADKKKEVVLKFIANSFYGVLGWDKFRLYDPEIAAFITRTGREINEYLQGLARGVGLEPIYGDSVSPTTPVIIKRNDRIHILPIDHCQSGDLTFNGSWVPIKHVIKKPLRKQMYHVSTGHGNVVCTCDHSLIKDGKEVCPQDLDKGDTIDHIDFPVQTHVEEGYINEDIAWIIGLFLAEGARFNTRQFVINNQDIKLLEECADRIERVCGKRVRISDYMESSNCHRISYIPPPISNYLSDCYVENTWHIGSPKPYQTTGYKIVPSYILNGNTSIQRAFFDGYYEGDGSKVSHKAIDSKNECLALGVHYIAEKLGLKVHCCVHKKSLSWGLRFPVGDIRKDRKVIKDLITIPPERLWFNHVVDLEIDDSSHTFATGKILLHNTDSIFVLGVRDAQHGIEVQNFLNKRLVDEWTPEHQARIAPQLKFEELFRTILFKPSSTNLEESAKKRYAGHVLFADGKPADRLLYKGIEVRRSDQANLIKTTLLRFLELVLMEDKHDEAIELIKTEYYNVRDGRSSLLDISIPQGITDMEKNSPRVRGVLYAEELFHIPYTGGEKPRLIYTRGDHDAFCLYDGIPIDQVPLKVRIDYPLMAEKIITKKMESYVLALGKNLRHILEGQQTLSSTWFE